MSLKITSVCYCSWVFILLLLFFALELAQAQSTQRFTGKAQQSQIDSLKRLRYPYVLPILGQKVARMGFEIPLPFGIMINNVYNTQQIGIQDLQVAFNGGRFFSVDSIVNFEQIKPNAFTSNIRVDAYLFPFLNVFGLLGGVKANTNFVISEPVSINNFNRSDGLYWGGGFVAAGGMGPLFGSFDYSWVWSRVKLLDKANLATNWGIRVGHIFKLPRRPESNIGLWAGINRQHIEGRTAGKISLYEALGIEGGGANAQESLRDVRNRIETWYNDLPGFLQNRFEEKVTTLLNGLDRVINGLEDPVVDFRFTKTLRTPYQFSLGGQWQLNPRWQLRSELGLGRDKAQVLFSANYRFGIKGQNLFDSTSR